MKTVNCKLMTIANEHFNCMKMVSCKVMRIEKVSGGIGGIRGALGG